MSRKLHYKCPDCPHVETVVLPENPHFDTSGLPQQQSILCRCGPCFSAKLDQAYPGARNRSPPLGHLRRSATGKKGPATA